jgi:hypothetical protein
MAKFKYSVNNGHYVKGQIIDLPIETAKAFERVKFGVIVTEEEKPKTKSKNKAK